MGALGSDVQDELDLLASMYPDEVTFDSRSAELLYQDHNGRLSLRLISGYPSSSSPEVISAAIGPTKNDVRDKIFQIIKAQPLGEPCLDAITAQFVALSESVKVENERNIGSDNPSAGKDRLPLEEGDRTVIIWLHHLLALSKRKQAISPEGTNGSSITGIAKPGYPGVLLFSGPAGAVDSHVQTLKHLRWQAFQVRYEADEKWALKHGNGIVEVETMSEIVAELETVDAGKDIFMEAMRIR
jgi:hypothetical protein